jgi:hypothetical protein
MFIIFSSFMTFVSSARNVLLEVHSIEAGVQQISDGALGKIADLVRGRRLIEQVDSAFPQQSLLDDGELPGSVHPNKA